MTKTQKRLMDAMELWFNDEDNAATATDIAIAMPSDHTIDFWVNQIVLACEIGFISKNESDEYFIELAGN